MLWCRGRGICFEDWRGLLFVVSCLCGVSCDEARRKFLCGSKKTCGTLEFRLRQCSCPLVRNTQPSYTHIHSGQPLAPAFSASSLFLFTSRAKISLAVGTAILNTCLTTNKALGKTKHTITISSDMVCPIRGKRTRSVLRLKMAFLARAIFGGVIQLRKWKLCWMIFGGGRCVDAVKR